MLLTMRRVKQAPLVTKQTLERMQIAHEFDNATERLPQSAVASGTTGTGAMHLQCSSGASAAAGIERTAGEATESAAKKRRVTHLPQEQELHAVHRL